MQKTARLERLIQYCARPPVAIERLQTVPDGRLRYELKRRWSDGTTHVVFHPLELLERLAALLPAPRAHLIRYSGVLAPAAQWRSRIVAEAAQIQAPPGDPTAVAADTVADSASAPNEPVRRRNYSWAELIKRVWTIDVLDCPGCQGRMRLLATIHSPVAIHRILDCLGLPSRPPPLATADRKYSSLAPKCF
jgi:Putative transposase